MFDKPVVLFSVQRSGSTWVQEYISEYNKIFGYNLVVPYEFLNDDFKEFKINNKILNFNNYNDKINYLNSHKISFKIQFNQIKDISWTNNYFREYHKIKLCRKNYWDQFVSYIIQHSTNWSHQKYYNNTINVSEDDVDYFIKILTDWTNIRIDYDELWNYEDLTNKILKLKFNKLNFESKYLLTTNDVMLRRNNYKNNINNYYKVKEIFKKKLENSSLII